MVRVPGSGRKHNYMGHWSGYSSFEIHWNEDSRVPGRFCMLQIIYLCIGFLIDRVLLQNSIYLLRILIVIYFELSSKIGRKK